MKSVDKIVTAVRLRTRNQDYTYDSATGIYTSGISTDLFLQFINDAQDHLQAILFDCASSLFITSEILNLVDGTAEYKPAVSVYGGVGYISVHANSASNTTDFGSPLRMCTPRELRDIKAFPSEWTPVSGYVRLSPIPASSSGCVRARFYGELDDLDIRRGKVSGTPTGVSVVLAATGPVPDQYALENADVICISDAVGNIMLRNGIVASYTTGTKTIALAANVSTYLATGYTLASLANGYVTIGENSTTNSKLPNNCERYLRTYCHKRIMTVDESNTSIEEDEELKKIETALQAVYAIENRDVGEIPTLDGDTAW